MGVVGNCLCGYGRDGSVWVGMVGKCLCGYGSEGSVWVW